VTSSGLYNIHKYQIKRKIKIKDIAGVSKSADYKIAEFIIHVEDDYDYFFPNKDDKRRDELFENLKAAYYYKMGKNLLVFKVNVPLKNYLTEKKDLKKGIQRHPPAGFLNELEDHYDTGIGMTTAEKQQAPSLIDADGNNQPTFTKRGMDSKTTL
jgi:hypothetical protein